MQSTHEFITRKQAVSILGCGWLGFALAEYLLTKKYKIKGSTTSQGKFNLLNQKGIEAFQIDLSSQNTIDPSFFNSQSLVINVPPGLRRNPVENHLNELRFLFNQLAGSNIKSILFISSTSIYSDLNREVNEDDANTESPIYKIEEEVRNHCQKTGIKLTILRCGGLMGYDRIPCKYYSGKKALDLDDTPVNYIHRDDLIEIIFQLLERGLENETFNAVCPEHPNRKTVIEDCCQKTEFVQPEYKQKLDEASFKIISSKKLMEALNYRFKYSSPLDFPYA